MLRIALPFAIIAMVALPALAKPSPQDSDAAYAEITAKVVLEDGSPLTSSPMVLLHQPGFEEQCAGQRPFGDGTLRLRVPRGRAGCEVSILLTGYRKFTGYVHDGTLITLHRTGVGEGSSVSMVSLSAPANAKKEYELGESAAARGKWPQADEHFRASVSLYPAYAVAWSELGQALQKQGHINEARAAFQRARQADPAYIKPIVQLAAASSVEQHWEEEMKTSEEAVNLHAVEFPAAHFYHAEATFHLGDLKEAERLTREAIELDPGGTCPDSHALPGKIFEKEGNPHDAMVEYRNYLKALPHGAQTREVKEALARLKHAN